MYCSNNGFVEAPRLLGRLKSDGVRSLTIGSSASIAIKIDGDVYVLGRSIKGDKLCDSKTRPASC